MDTLSPGCLAFFAQVDCAELLLGSQTSLGLVPAPFTYSELVISWFYLIDTFLAWVCFQSICFKVCFLCLIW